MALPIKHKTKSIFSLPVRLFVIRLRNLFFEAKLSTSPLFYLRVVCPCYYSEHLVSEFGNSKVCICTK